MTEVKRRWVVDGTSSMYARARARVCVCVCVKWSRGACINMPRFGRTVVSLCNLGFGLC